ncbi:MAG TPA: xanthine dehydrogenase family protein molybdopterin-binding subunit [Chloroflexota bacterium]|nr:xanthine dehydrogenase family protein molybdopterin-binding subunit [Chloroflexota bacterium]
MSTVQERFSVVGTVVPRLEAVRKVTGQANFGADTVLPGMLWCKFVRSPYPHARIKRVDTSKALALAGVRAVITAADIPSRLWGRRLQDVPVLAIDKVRFIGEKVAAVAADGPHIAEQAALLVDIDYEELPAIFSAAEAIKGEVLIHEPDAAYADAPPSWWQLPNVQSYVVMQHGDAEAAMAQADVVIEHEFHTQAAHQGYIEPHAYLAEVDDSGRVRLFAPNKMPNRSVEIMSPLFDLPPEAIDINPTYIGGDFGGKGSPMDAPAVIYLAMKTRRPVKYVMSYAEDLMATNPRHSGVIRIKTGLKRDGAIVARQGLCLWEAGAYGGFKPSPAVSVGGHQLVGSYRIENYKIEAICAYTNEVPRGHVRAPGSPQCYFASESHMDMLAHELAMDPLEFRLKNADGKPQQLEVVDKALAASGWRTPKPKWRGRGLAFGDHGTGVGFATIRLILETDGRVTLLTGLPDTGTGALTVLQQVVAEALGIQPGMITVQTRSTLDAPPDSGAGASRVTHVAGRAAVAAAEALKQELAKRGWRVGRVPEPVSAQGTYEAPRGSGSATGYICQVAEVSVDPETGQVKLEKLTTAHEVGTIVNPLMHQGQVEGGIIQGVGFGLMEDLQIAGGRVGAAHLGEYKMPTMADVPPLATELVGSSDGPGPFAAKAIGESSNILTAAAIANAVFDASRARVTDLPVTAEKVYRLLR